MADRDNEWSQLERGNRELAELRGRDYTSNFSTFSEFNSRQDKASNGYNIFGGKRRITIGQDTFGVLIRSLARELKLSPKEISTWSLSDIVYMYSDLISKNDIELYSMYESNQKIQQTSNTHKL